MKTSIYSRSKNKWSEREALIDILISQNLKEEQLQAEHNEKQYRWRVKPEEDTSFGILGNLIVIVLLVIGGIFGVDYLKNETKIFETFTTKEVKVDEEKNDNNVEVNNGIYDKQTRDFDSPNETSNENSVNENPVNENRLIICPNCNGSGEAYTKCNCKNGYIEKMYQNTGEDPYTEHKRCKGRGEIIDICKVCRGNGRVNEYQ